MTHSVSEREGEMEMKETQPLTSKIVNLQQFLLAVSM